MPILILMDNKLLKKSLVNSYTDKRNGFAHALDSIGFALVSALGIYALLLSYINSNELRLILSIDGALIILIAITYHRRKLFSRHVSRLKTQMHQSLITEELLLMDEAELERLLPSEYCRNKALYIQNAAPLGDDDVYALLRRSAAMPIKPVTAVCVNLPANDLSVSSEALKSVRFLTFQELIPKSSIEIDSQKVEHAIIEKFYKKRKPVSDRDASIWHKYFIIGAVLYAASFIMRYGTYLRFAAIVSCTLGARIAIFDRMKKPRM